MVKKIVRTTQQRTVDERGMPVETVQEREVVRTLHEPEEFKEYDHGGTLPDYYRPNEPAASRSNESALGTRLQTQESRARQQLAVLRDIDYRLTHLEEADRGWAAAQSTEQATWWAMWGILMLILGSALAIILVLIFSSMPH